MAVPSLLILDSVIEYREYYEKHYCRSQIYTFDNIRVYFSPQKFGHAFYKNSLNRRGAKDEFCCVRAQRMGWIKLTLEHPEAELFMGWNSKSKKYDGNRRVSVVFEDFVVVIEINLSKKDILKGNFITCYQADKSINKIRNSPRWSKEKYLAER